jgi:hypothetical protein
MQMPDAMAARVADTNMVRSGRRRSKPARFTLGRGGGGEAG